MSFRWLFSDDFEGFLFFHCRFPLSSEILYSGLVLVSYLPKISFYWNFSHLSGYTFQFFEKFETNFTETKLIADAGLPTGDANLSEYGKQSCSSMLILSRFSVKFVSQYSTDVGNIFYICGVIAEGHNILMKVFCFLLEWESGKFTDARTQQATFTTCLVIYRSTSVRRKILRQCFNY